MYKKKHVLVCDDDLKRYPPLISIINILLTLNCDVIFLGYCSDKLIINNLQSKGLVYQKIKVDKVEKNILKKIIMMFLNKMNVVSFLKNNNCDKNTLVWIFGNENGWRFSSIFEKYKIILYLFEFPLITIPIKYRLVVPFLNLKKSIQNAHKVVCCEYNRAHITKAFFDLKTIPYIIPNKIFITDEANDLEDVDKYLSEVEIKLLNEKKVILYQGAINKSRKLDAICEAIEYLDDDFIFCIMGTESDYKEFLKSKYKNDRILFLPFIPPPSHLNITKLAYIGMLTYVTDNNKIEECLNLLFCAPNKSYEYSKYSIPMLSNALPSLERDFLMYNSGICSNEFSPKEIANCIMKISNNYNYYTNGAKLFYESINIEEMIKFLISEPLKTH